LRKVEPIAKPTIGVGFYILRVNKGLLRGWCNEKKLEYIQ